MCQDWFKFFQGFWNRPIFNSGMILQSCHICKCDPLASLLLPSLVGCPCSSAEEYSILYVLWNKCIFSNFQLSYLVEIRSHMFENILISFIQELCVTRMNAWNWHSSPVGGMNQMKKKVFDNSNDDDNSHGQQIYSELKSSLEPSTQTAVQTQVLQVKWYHFIHCCLHFPSENNKIVD